MVAGKLSKLSRLFVSECDRYWLISRIHGFSKSTTKSTTLCTNIWIPIQVNEWMNKWIQEWMNIDSNRPDIDNVMLPFSIRIEIKLAELSTDFIHDTLPKFIYIGRRQNCSLWKKNYIKKLTSCTTVHQSTSYYSSILAVFTLMNMLE